jgi:hypothetical protein
MRTTAGGTRHASNDARSLLVEPCPRSKIVEGDNRFKGVSIGQTRAMIARVREGALASDHREGLLGDLELLVGGHHQHGHGGVHMLRRTSIWMRSSRDSRRSFVQLVVREP